MKMFSQWIGRSGRSFLRTVRLRRSSLGLAIKSFLFKHRTDSRENPLILAWELGGFSALFKKNAILATALRVRGYRTHAILCDGTARACIQRGLEKKQEIRDWGKICGGCLAAMTAVARDYGVSYSTVGRYVGRRTRRVFKTLSSSLSREAIFHFKYLGVNVGELAWSSVNRYMKGFIVDIVQMGGQEEQLFREYFYAALVNTHAAQAALRRFGPLSVYTSHGVYVDYAPPMTVSILNGAKSISWVSGYRNSLHYFTVPKGTNKLELTGISEREWEKRLAMPLDGTEQHRLDRYINERYYKFNARDIKITAPPVEQIEIRRALGIDNDRPIVCLFTHINWDSCFDLGTMLFDSANQWVIESLRKMISITGVNWLVRIHPAERTEGSLYTTDDLIKREFPTLPQHIKVLWHDSGINSLSIFRVVDLGITIFGTVGVELSLLGKPVLLAGNAHFSGKGFTIDPKSRSEYLALLERAGQIGPLSPEKQQIARQYAYSYFIERQIPLNQLDRKQGHWADVDISRIADMLPGKDPVLDRICEAIVRGTDVILNESEISQLDAQDGGSA
jgi:hypothetical protein